MIVRLLARVAVWGLALVAIASYVMLGWKRLHYPLELDCIEGVILDHVVRLAHGQPIYVAPSLEFIPLAYMPLFVTVSSFLARIWAPALWEPRLVSFVSSLLVTGLIAGVVLAETRRATMAVAGAGIYAMGYGFVGGSYDIARPDSFMLLLAFSGLAVLRATRGIPGAIVSALLLSLAFFAKQHAMLFAWGAVLHLLVTDRRRAVPFMIALVVGTSGVYWLISMWLGPWFRFYTYEVPKGWSEFSHGRLVAYLGDGLFGQMAAMSIPCVLALGSGERPWRSPSGLWMWTGLAGLGTGVLATLDPWAYRHVFTPTIVALAILGPISLDRLARQLEAGTSAGRGLGTAVAYWVLALQFLPLLYPVRSQMPRPGASEAHAELLARVKALPGPVMIPYHPFFAWQAGEHSGLDMIALDDIGRAHGNSYLRRDPHALERMFAPLRSGPGRPSLVTDLPLDRMGPLWVAIAPGYALRESFPEEFSNTLRPVTGNRRTPTYVYVPVESAAADSAVTASRR